MSVLVQIFICTLNSVDTVIMDKTGTLTKGVFSVKDIYSFNDFSNDDVLYFATGAELHSNHPIAISIKNAYKVPFLGHIKTSEELAGYGIKAKIDGKEVLVGNYKLLSMHSITHTPLNSPNTVVCVAIDGLLCGYLVIADELKDDSKKAVSMLKELGIKNITILTGDNKEVAKNIADQLDIKSVYGELLPHQKVEQLEAIMASKRGSGKTLFVGDGINDAPVLARSDIGIAMGGVGSDAAIEAADVVIMTDEISKVATAIKIARKTHQIVWQNIIFALGVKGVILIMGAFGIATMWEAVFGDVGVALIAVLNASRVLRKEY